MAISGLSFLTFNIGNPSEQRAQRQLEWLAGRPEHVLVLTETKASVGCRLLADAFTTAGWHVNFPVPGPGEYGTMILSRVHRTTAKRAVSFLLLEMLFIANTMFPSALPRWVMVPRACANGCLPANQ